MKKTALALIALVILALAGGIAARSVGSSHPILADSEVPL